MKTTQHTHNLVSSIHTPHQLQLNTTVTANSKPAADNKINTSHELVVTYNYDQTVSVSKGYYFMKYDTDY